MNKGYIYLTITILIFGPFEVISKLVHGIDAIQLNFLRFLIGGLALLPFAIHDMRRRKIVIRPRDLLSMIGLGILYIPISMVFLQVAIQNTAASLSTFVFSSNPVFIAIFAAWILKEKPNTFIVFFFKPILGTIYAIVILNERLTAGFIIGASLIVLGSVVMIYGKERSGPVKN